jgi:hypothetical protein
VSNHRYPLNEQLLTHPLQAHPLPLWHVLSAAMQLSPQAFPFLQTLQQA